MADWLSSMQRTYEYYIVDPGTWKDIRKIDNIKTSTIVRDSSVETLGSATLNMVDTFGECYVRIYLVTIQNGLTERFPLATVLVQTPSTSFNGKTTTVTVDAYTPLLELKENPPPIGYSRLKGENIMQAAYEIVRENARAPVVKPASEFIINLKRLIAQSGKSQSDIASELQIPEANLIDWLSDIAYPSPNEIDKLVHYFGIMRKDLVGEDAKTLSDDFVSNTSDTWTTFTSDLIAKAKHEFALDDMGRILFAPKQEVTALQPVWTYTDDNSSILHADISMDHDLYGIPNVVEVVYSSQGGAGGGEDMLFSTVVNDDPNSPTSTVSRGRRIVYRDTNPALSGNPFQSDLDEYAKRLLEELSTVEYKISYTHGYCPVRLGDCVRLNYNRAGLKDIKAKVVYQSIACTASCTVTEKAVFTKKLWG